MAPDKFKYTNSPTTIIAMNIIQRNLNVMFETYSLEDYYYIITFVNGCSDAKVDFYTWDEDGQQLCYNQTQYASSYPSRAPHQGVLVKNQQYN